MSNRFASNKKAISVCDRCGFRYKLRELRNIFIKDRNTNLLVCPECWEPSQPQLDLGKFPVDDPQALRDPRPDFTEYPESRAQIVPVFGYQMTGFVGNVTVTV